MVVRPEGYQEAGGPPDDEEGEDSEKDDRYPKITEEDWKARERARKLLRNILTRQVEAVRGAAQGPAKGVAGGSLALRTRRGNRSRATPMPC